MEAVGAVDKTTLMVIGIVINNDFRIIPTDSKLVGGFDKLTLDSFTEMATLGIPLAMLKVWRQ